MSSRQKRGLSRRNTPSERPCGAGAAWPESSFLRSRRTERESSALETPCSAVTASPAMGMTRTPKRVTQTPSSMESTIYAADPMLRAMP